MNFLKALFGGKTESPEEKRKAEENKNFDVLKYDGVRALHAGQAEYAIKCLTHALEIREDLEIRDYLSQAYLRNDDALAAYGQLEKLAEAQPDNEQIFIRMARVAFIMENYGAMADACEKAMLADNDNPEVLYMYARACWGKDDTMNAVAMLTKAITLKDDYGDARLLRGDILMKTGDTESAEEDVQWLLEKVPEHEEVLILKARLESAKGNTEEALAFYGKVIDANPFSAEAYRERSALRQKTGDKDGAEDDLAKLKEIAPENNTEDIEQQTSDMYRQKNPYGF